MRGMRAARPPRQQPCGAYAGDERETRVGTECVRARVLPDNDASRQPRRCRVREGSRRGQVRREGKACPRRRASLPACRAFVQQATERRGTRQRWQMGEE